MIQHSAFDLPVRTQGPYAYMDYTANTQGDYDQFGLSGPSQSQSQSASQAGWPDSLHGGASKYDFSFDESIEVGQLVVMWPSCKYHIISISCHCETRCAGGNASFSV